jgi:4-hydroxy-tetrahydrodipicolinate reductase
MDKTAVIVCGSSGKMGQSIISLLKDDQYQDLILIGGVDINNSENITKESINLKDIEDKKISFGKFVTLKEALHFTSSVKNKVVIDFTSRQSSLIHAEEAMLYSVPIVIGSTGFNDEDIAKITGFAKHMPVVLSGNMSLGINVLLSAVYDISEHLGKDYDCEIIEMHHRHKKDAPSGTALMLANAVAEAKKLDLKESAVYGRCGEIGERLENEIGISSVRAGDIIGEHKVIFAGNDEVIEITHKAISRNNFARGAIKAALWLKDKKMGFYDMRDVLGLEKRL